MMEIMAYATSGREFEVMDELSDMGITYWHGKRIEFERRGKSRIAEPFEYPALPNYLHITAPFHLVSDIMYIRHLSRTIKFLHAADVRGWQVFERAADARLAEAQGIVDERKRMEAEHGAAVLAMQKRHESRQAELAAAKALRQSIINLISGYSAGDALEITGGPFKGMLATFGRMVVKLGTAHPMVEASVQIFGRDTPADFDPLDVRKAG